jgi:hypothetical protein
MCVFRVFIFAKLRLSHLSHLVKDAKDVRDEIEDFTDVSIYEKSGSGTRPVPLPASESHPMTVSATRLPFLIMPIKSDQDVTEHRTIFLAPLVQFDYSWFDISCSLFNL